jgi:hypothetical protein
MSFIINLYDMIATHETTLSVAYNEKPRFLNNSQGAYECFRNVAHCTYEHPLLYVFKIGHVIFITITIIAYVCIFVTLDPQRQNNSPKCSNITYLGIAKGVVLLMLVLNSGLLFVIFIIDQHFTSKCDKLSFMVHLENMLTYLVINIVEAVYILHDILSTSHKADLHSPYERIPKPPVEGLHAAIPLLNNNQINRIDQNNDSA